MKLSILIPTLPSRLAMFTRLMSVLEPQLTPDVELLWLGDNKTRILGDKRNELLRMASSLYVTFIDDDDLPHATEYVSRILDGIESGSDVIVFDQWVSINDGPLKRCRYGIELEYTETAELWTGKPAHTQVYKASIAKQCAFPGRTFGEDHEWVQQAWPLCETQTRLDCEPLYTYMFNRLTTETRPKRKSRNSNANGSNG